MRATPHKKKVAGTTLATIDAEAISEAKALINEVESLVLDNPAEAQCAADLRNDIKARQDRIKGWFEEPISKAYQAHRELTQRRAVALYHYDRVLRLLDGKLKIYHQEMQRLEREAAEIAERERQRQIEEYRQDKALEAAARGDSDLAQRVVEGKTPEPIIVVPVAQTAPPIEGVSFHVEHGAKVVNLMDLVRAVAEGRETIDLLEVNQTSLNKRARALGDAFAVPGCILVTDQRIHRR